MKRGGRLDFYYLGNIVSITTKGYLSIYATLNIRSAVNNIEDTFQRIGESFLPYTKGIEHITYRAVNIHLSGKFSLKSSALIAKLKLKFQAVANVLEIVLGTEANDARLQDPNKIPDEVFLYSYVQLKVAEGKLTVLHTGSYTIITTRFQYIAFWKLFTNEDGH